MTAEAWQRPGGGARPGGGTVEDCGCLLPCGVMVEVKRKQVELCGIDLD